jgi:hypothetical protein
LGVIIFFIAMYHVSCYACSWAGEACAPRDTIITELAEPLKKGIEEKYGYIIPDNAELIFGKVRHGRDSTLKLYYSVTLDGLPGYEPGMALSEIYEIMWDGKKSDVDYGSCSYDGIEEFEEEHNVKFSFLGECDRVPYTGMWLTEPKDGKIFVYIDGHRPSSDWY